MKIFDWIRKEVTTFNFILKGDDKIFTGAILPTNEQLAEMPDFSEMVAEANPVNWKTLDITKTPKYMVYSQNGSGSCVAFSVCLIATILYKLRRGMDICFSASYIYQQRTNQGSGMIGTEAFKIASKGMLLNELMPSFDLTETAINSVPKYPEYDIVAQGFAFEDRLVQLPIKDIDTIASVLQTTGKPINVWFEFNNAEWTSEPKILTNNIQARHSVVAVDYGMWNGKKAIVIQDSWGKW